MFVIQSQTKVALFSNSQNRDVVASVHFSHDLTAIFFTGVLTPNFK